MLKFALIKLYDIFILYPKKLINRKTIQKLSLQQKNDTKTYRYNTLIFGTFFAHIICQGQNLTVKKKANV